MKIIIAGGRNFHNYQMLRDSCDFILGDQGVTEVVGGGASGADVLGERYAAEQGIPCRRFEADWQRYGRSAGPRRNVEMADYADALIAFWDGESRGTKHMIEAAQKRGLRVWIIRYSWANAQ